ncbi:MAG: DegT/DnrJ/EryC1/StrS family aminotransferase [Fidelibacterota bacterium]
MTSKVNKRIYLSPPHLGVKELEYVRDAIESNWIAPLGPQVDAFEKEISEYIGVKNAVALSSGTAALHLALRLCDVQAGDSVFCSDLTFVASANVIMYENATPIFIDSDWQTWTMCPKGLQAAFNEAEMKRQLPKAVIITDLYGQSADYDSLVMICNRYNVPVIEDSAEALGSSYKQQKCGSLGRMAALSFNGNKMITTSGGGMLLSHESTLVEKARFLSTQARDDALHYEHSELGYNYRMSNILAALGRGQLTMLDTHVSSCRAIYERYKEGLSSVSNIQFMPEADYGKSTRWLTVLTLNSNDINKEDIIEALAEENIEARPVWKPMHLQPLYKDCLFHSVENIPISETVFNNGICLPSGVDLSVKDQEKIISIIQSIFT